MMQTDGRRRLLEAIPVSRETIDLLDRYVEILLRRNSQHNLIGRSTEADVWDRHILDSAQLSKHSKADAADWLDVGAGAGLPGLVLAIMTNANHVLVEPRRLRAEFLRDVVDALGLDRRVKVVQSRVEVLKSRRFDVVTARAFATLAQTLMATRHIADAGTVWLLHKGRKAQEEIDEAKSMITATFERLPSLTAEDAAIVRVSDMKATT